MIDTKTDHGFLTVFYERHMLKKQGQPVAPDINHDHLENIWMDFMGLGKLETYRFIYGECRDEMHLKDWIISLRGASEFETAVGKFQRWKEHQESGKRDHVPVERHILNEEQLLFWETHGYLKVSGLLADNLCDEVKELICTYLNIDLTIPETWYRSHHDWQGLMVQVYQDPRQEAIRRHPAIHQLFAELYGTDQLLPNTEKLGFNPPETDSWQFSNGELHWDINLSRPVTDHIQGLLYLDEVPEERGPLTLVPGFHHQFKAWFAPFETLDDAHQVMRKTMKAIPVPGKKGDLVLWKQTLPHAASVNRSGLPRFVQYLSFSKL